MTKVSNIPLKLTFSWQIENKQIEYKLCYGNPVYKLKFVNVKTLGSNYTPL